MRMFVNSWPVLIFPSRLIINNFTLGFVRREFKKEGIILTRQQTARFVREFRKSKKRHPDWVLAEFEKNGGKKIRIKL